MNTTKAIKAVTLILALSVSLYGCSDKNKESKQQVQFMSHMDQARFFQKQGELKASNQEAESANQINPKNIEPYLLIVDNLLIVGDVASTEHELDQIEAHLGKDQPPHVKNQLAIDWAKVEILRRNYSSALKHLDNFKLPKKNPELEKSKFASLRGEILLAQGKPGEAEAAFKEAEKQNPKSVAAKIGLSKVTFANGNHNQASKFIAEALKLDKDDSQAWLWKAQMAEKEKDYATAEDAYMKALDGIGKYDVMTYQKYTTMSALVDVLRAEGKFQQAYVYEEILAKSAPGTIKSELEAAAKAYKQGQLDEAATHLETILKRAPGNPQSMLLLGLIRYQQGKPQDAERLLKPLEKQGASVEATKLLAATQIQLGQSQAAQQMLSKLKGADKDPGILALVGVAALSAGEIDAGRKYIEKSLSLNPKNVSLRLRYANWLMDQHEYSLAAEQARLAVKSAPDLALARRLEMNALLQDNRSQEAYDVVHAWRKEQPKNADAVLANGDLEAAQNHLNTALAEYKHAARMAPKSPAPQLSMGKVYMAQKDPAKALQFFKNAVKLAPNNREALEALLATTNKHPDTYPAVIKFLQDLAQKDSKAVGPRIVLLENELRQSNFKESEKLANQIDHAQANPNAMKALMTRVYVSAADQFIQKGKNADAGKVISLGAARLPNNLELGLAKTGLLLREGKTSEAMAQLKSLKKDHANSPRPYLFEAAYRVQQKQYDEAINQYKLALQISDAPGVYIALANTQNQAGLSDATIKTLQKASKLYPDNPSILLQLGLAYQSVKKIDDAQQTYEKVIKLSPEQPIALNNLAWIYQQKGDKRALQTAKKAYELQPQSASIADTYGWILYNQGEVKGSIPILEKAHKLNPKEKEISLHLAEAYKSAGEPTKAKSILETF